MVAPLIEDAVRYERDYFGHIDRLIQQYLCSGNMYPERLHDGPPGPSVRRNPGEQAREGLKKEVDTVRRVIKVRGQENERPESSDRDNAPEPKRSANNGAETS